MNLPISLISAYRGSALELLSASHPRPIANEPEETKDEDE